MMINKRECILCNTHEEVVELLRELKAEGYKCCTGAPLDELYVSDKHRGFRWMPTDTFPDCIAYVQEELAEEFINYGFSTLGEYPHDYGVDYKITFRGGHLISKCTPEVDDLL